MAVGDVRETVIGYCVGDDYMCVDTQERKYINKLIKWSEMYPDKVSITYDMDADCNIYGVSAKVDKSYFRFIAEPKERRKLSEEELNVRSERMKKMRLAKKEESAES